MICAAYSMLDISVGSVLGPSCTVTGPRVDALSKGDLVLMLVTLSTPQRDGMCLITLIDPVIHNHFACV
jgi:hypothetical protein